MQQNPNSIAEYQQEALSKLGPSLTDYIQKSAGEGRAFQSNLTAYSKYAIVPSAIDLGDHPDVRIKVLGKTISAPVMIAPTAWHKMFTPNGEADTCAAAKEFGTRYVISSFSTLSFEEMGMDLSHAWYQLLLYRDLGLMKRYIKEAENAGCSAIVLTVDAVNGCSMCKSDPSVPPITFPVHKLPLFPEEPALPYTTLDDYYEKYMPGVLDWQGIREIVASTKLPVVLKGILTVDDAKKAVEVGAKAIIVSNHGGRQNDSAPATLSVLENIAGSVGDKIDIYIDGGVRTGEDIFKAVALGARGVFIGRPALYGLALRGKDGLVDVLSILDHELQEAMRKAGCATIQDIHRNNVRPV